MSARLIQISGGGWVQPEAVTQVALNGGVTTVWLGEKRFTTPLSTDEVAKLVNDELDRVAPRGELLVWWLRTSPSTPDDRSPPPGSAREGGFTVAALDARDVDGARARAQAV